MSVDEDLVKVLIKPHQVHGIKFMFDATVESVKKLKEGDSGNGCILAHCMGLGKTLQVVTLCHTLLTNDNINTSISRILVCCPVNTINNWVAEFEYWLSGKLSFPVVEMASAGTVWGQANRLDEWWRSGGVCIIGYQMFLRLSRVERRFD